MRRMVKTMIYREFRNLGHIIFNCLTEAQLNKEIGDFSVIPIPDDYKYEVYYSKVIPITKIKVNIKVKRE